MNLTSLIFNSSSQLLDLQNASVIMLKTLDKLQGGLRQILVDVTLMVIV